MTETTVAKKKAVVKAVKKVKAVKVVKKAKTVNTVSTDNADPAGKTNTVSKVNRKAKSPGVLYGKELVDAVVSVLEEKLAERVAVIDLRNVSAAADWFIICSGDNTSHTSAVASSVVAELKAKHGTAPWHHEGIEDGRWALIDYTDVVVHVMLGEVREYYNLEGLWNNLDSQDKKITINT